MTVSRDDVPPQIGSYRILRQLGRGGMSVVYLAEHVHLQRRVALKVISTELAADETFRTRFLRESQIAATLEHPHIVPIYDAGESDDQPYIAMRYIDGPDLSTLLKAGPISNEQTVRIISQIADALDTAHDAGLVHRDVKPANILVAAGSGGADHCYLGDFGITKRMSAGQTLTGTGQIIGTIDYIAPEQIEGGPIDGRADVYALGCVVYRCLTGRAPFERAGEMAVLVAHLRDEVAPPSRLRPGLPPRTDAVVRRALAKSPDQRFARSSELAAELRDSLVRRPPPRPATASVARATAPVGAPHGSATAVPSRQHRANPPQLGAGPAAPVTTHAPAGQRAARAGVGRPTRRQLTIAALAVTALLVAGAVLTRAWINEQYFVAAHQDQVAIFHGVQGEVPVLGALNDVELETDIALNDLPESARLQVAAGIPTPGGLPAAQETVNRLRDQLLPACSPFAPASPFKDPVTRPGDDAPVPNPAAGTDVPVPNEAARPTPTVEPGITCRVS